MNSSLGVFNFTVLLFEDDNDMINYIQASNYTHSKANFNTSGHIDNNEIASCLCIGVSLTEENNQFSYKIRLNNSNPTNTEIYNTILPRTDPLKIEDTTDFETY